MKHHVVTGRCLEPRGYVSVKGPALAKDGSGYSTN